MRSSADMPGNGVILSQQVGQVGGVGLRVPPSPQHHETCTMEATNIPLNTSSDLLFMNISLSDNKITILSF
jgi:hypothetical protein